MGEATKCMDWTALNWFGLRANLAWISTPSGRRQHPLSKVSHDNMNGATTRRCMGQKAMPQWQRISENGRSLMQECRVSVCVHTCVAEQWMWHMQREFTVCGNAKSLLEQIQVVYSRKIYMYTCVCVCVCSCLWACGENSVFHKVLACGWNVQWHVWWKSSRQKYLWSNGLYFCEV